MNDTNDDHGAQNRFGRPGAAPAPEKDWILDSLKRLYDDTASEPIPPEMLALLAQIDKAEEERGPAPDPSGQRP